MSSVRLGRTHAVKWSTLVVVLADVELADGRGAGAAVGVLAVIPVGAAAGAVAERESVHTGREEEEALGH